MNLILFLACFYSINTWSFDVPTFEQLEKLEITKEMALELGMTPLEKYLEKSNIQFELATNLGLDVENNELNKQIAPVVFIINKSKRTKTNPEGQSIRYYVNGIFQRQFSVSTGKDGLVETTDGEIYFASTPVGFYRIKKAYDHYYSYSFFGAYMRYAMFFNEGIAIHATKQTWSIGNKGSGGCVRMREEDIKILSDLLLETGENHREIETQRICKGQTCYNRELFKNRILLNDVEEKSSALMAKKILTYDAVVVVREGKLDHLQ